MRPGIYDQGFTQNLYARFSFEKLHERIEKTAQAEAVPKDCARQTKTGQAKTLKLLK